MPRQIFGARAWLEYAPFAAFYHAFKRIPLERAVRIGASLGTLAAKLDRINRPIAMRNLEIAFPQASEGERLTILTRAYQNWGRAAAEWCHFEQLTTENIGQFVILDGLENLFRAKERSNGHGILFLSAHFGNFELLVLAASLHGFPLALVQRPLRNPLIAARVNRARESGGNVTVARRRAGRAVLRLLRQDIMVGLAIDLDVRRGIFVDFFSMPASTTEAPAKLATVSHAPLLAGFIVREGATPRHRVAIMPEIEVPREGTREEAVRQCTQHFTTAFEEMVRRYPDHWNWIHRRWKTRPPGEPRFY
jgi:KDO2-lipid IV(A) lauroyltransferase